MMADQQRIFLGHASEDKARVRELYRRVRADGFAPWLDAEDLMPGQNWRVEIPKAIKSSAVFLACLSKTSIAKRGYVQREFRLALSVFAEIPQGSIYLIPVRLDDCEVPDLSIPELELTLADFQWVNLFEPDGYPQLLMSLRTALRTPAASGCVLGRDDRLSEVMKSFKALYEASVKATKETDHPSAVRIRDNLADCLDDLRCCGGDLEVLATFPSHLAGLKQNIDEHLLRRHFEAVPVSEVLSQLQALTAVVGIAGANPVDTLDHENLVAALKATIGRALDELSGTDFDCEVTKIADRELRHLRREVGKTSFDAAVVSRCRQRLEQLKLNLIERTGLLTEALLAEGFPNLPTGTVFRHLPEIWCPQFVMIPAGTFLMGLAAVNRFSNEGPQHQVTLTKSFGLGRYAVTYDEYYHFCEMTGRERPYVEQDQPLGMYPLSYVSHDDAVAYCAWLSGATGACLELPTEAMWEYACRAGTTTPFSFGANITTDQVNFRGNSVETGGAKEKSRAQTVPVGSLPANGWGLHEMHGNVQEWCADWHARRYAPDSVVDPKGPEDGTGRVMRGGSWFDADGSVSSSARGCAPPDLEDHDVIPIGFRIASFQIF